MRARRKRKASRGKTRFPRTLGRWPAAAAAALAIAALLYLFVLPAGKAEPHLVLPKATATIGSGSDAVAVSADGTVLPWLPLPEEIRLPRLPLAEPPGKLRLGGPVLEQALVLGAAPATLRPYLDSSHYDESGVGVELRSGIELRFGDATGTTEKWRAAAAVLADPDLTALDYVNLLAPKRPTVGGSGHTLPTLP